MPRFAPVMSVDDFKSTLVSTALKNDFETEYNKLDLNDPHCYEDICMFLYNQLPEIAKDWSKIQFDCENMMLEGFESTPLGIPYVRLLCGGDWESPVHAIIYFDGKNFRGYVPTKGNTFNPKTKVAYGNEMDDEDYDPQVDYAALNADIAARIQPRA